MEAHDKAIKAVKEGIKACEVDKVARDIISEYGYGDNFIHTTGHSLGLDIHERPTVALRDKTVLENNMEFTLKVNSESELKTWFSLIKKARL